MTPAAFEAVPGGQDALLADCRTLAQAEISPPSWDRMAGSSWPWTRVRLGLREGAGELLGDPVRCHWVCGAAYCRSRNYRSAFAADAFLKVVRVTHDRYSPASCRRLCTAGHCPL